MKTSQRTNKSKIYTVIIPRFEDIFHSFYSGEVIKGIGLAASHLKADLLIHITERFGRHEDWLSSPSLNPKYIDGILFADINGDTATLKKVIARKIPYLVLNNFFDKPINCIAIDNRKATIEIINYLVSLGHKQIATIAGDLSTQAGKMRLEGFKEAMKKHRLTVKDDYIVVGDFLRTPAHRAAEKLLSLDNRPTAIFAASDVMALETIDVAKKQGIKIPNELSIVGFDDNPLNVYSPVKLTTVAQPIVEMGRIGLERLHQIVLGKVELPTKTLLGTRLIKRDSCAALKERTNK